MPQPPANAAKELNKLVNKEETGMNRELFQKHFKYERPSSMLRELFHMKKKK